MKKTFCDRCGKEIVIPDVIPRFRIQECDNDFCLTEFKAEYTYDLCSKCQLDLKYWLEGKENNHGTNKR